MHVASAFSEHPLATRAVGECIGDLLERRGADPDLLMLWITDHHVRSAPDIVRAIKHLIAPGALIGSAAEAVMGGNRLVRGRPGMAMFALWRLRVLSPLGVDQSAGSAIEPRWDERDSAQIRTFRLDPGGDTIAGGGSEHSDLDGLDGALLVLADPFTAPLNRLLERIDQMSPELQVAGGHVSGGRRMGGTTLLLDDEIHHSGAVGVHIPATLPVRSRSTADIANLTGVPSVDGVALEAEERLRSMLQACDSPSGVLVFSDAGRWTSDHEDSNGDPLLISEMTGARDLAGMTCFGEVVRRGVRRDVLDGAVSMLLFG